MRDRKQSKNRQRRFSARHSISCKDRSIASVDLRRAPNDHVLVFAIHHAIADGWSLGVLVQDLFAAYVEVVMGSIEALPPVPQTYSAWGATERAFWKPEMIGAAHRVLENQTSRIHVECGIRRSRRVRRCDGSPQFLRSLTNETRELARRTSVTFFSALFGAFQIAFSEWSGFDDLVVGTPVANRTQTERKRETMGYYAGIVPLRGQIDRSRVASDHLRAGHQQTVDSFANAIPFVELARALGEKSATGIQSTFRSALCFAEPSDAGCFAAESFRAS